MFRTGLHNRVFKSAKRCHLENNYFGELYFAICSYCMCHTDLYVPLLKIPEMAKEVMPDKLKVLAKPIHNVSFLSLFVLFSNTLDALSDTSQSICQGFGPAQSCL